MRMTKTHFSTFNRLNFHFQSIHRISLVVYSYGFWLTMYVIYACLVVPSITSTRERTRPKHVFTWRQTSEFQVSNFEVFPPKCEVLLLGTAQREDVFNQQERKKSWQRCPTFKRFAESIKRTCAGLYIVFQKLGEDYASARVQFQKSLSSTTWLEARLLKSGITFEQFPSVLSKTLFCWRPWFKQEVRPLLKNCPMIWPFTVTAENCQHQQLPEILGTNFQVAATIPEKDWGNVRQSVLLPKI